MNMNNFAKWVCRKEGKKRQVNICQIKEILKIINDCLDGRLYEIIKHKGGTL